MKAKILKKVIALVLAGTMVAGLTACGEKTPPETKAPETPTEATKGAEGDQDIYTVIKDENGNPLDFGGMQLVIRDWWSGSDPDENFANRVVPNDEFSEAQEEYRQWLMETYNFTVTNCGLLTEGSQDENFTTYVTNGGDDNYYIFTLQKKGSLYSCIDNGLLYDLNTLEPLDFTEPQWEKNIKAATTKGDSTYGMNPNGLGNLSSTGLYFNKRLLEEAGVDPDELYELQENMEWNWAKFEEIAEKIQTDKDNDGEIDHYALGSFDAGFYSTVVYSNGGSYVGKDENGLYYNNSCSDATLEALNWAKQFRDKYEIPRPQGAQWNFHEQAFKDGETVFCLGGINGANGYRDMEDDFGYVCFPMGPSTTDYVSPINNLNVDCIPSCYDAEKAEKIALAYSLWNKALPEFGDEVWKYNLSDKLRDTKSIDLTMARQPEIQVDTYDAYIPGLIVNDLIWKLEDGNTPAQQAEANKNSWDALIEEANAAMQQ